MVGPLPSLRKNKMSGICFFYAAILKKSPRTPIQELVPN